MLYKAKEMINYKNIFMGFIRYSSGIYMVNVDRNKDIYNKIKKNLLQSLERAINSRKDTILKRNKDYLRILKRKLNQHKTMSNIRILSLKFTTTARLLIDVSSPLGWAIDEIGLAWDGILDTPYIPATAIKGVFRAKLENKILSELIKQTATNGQQKLEELIETAQRYTNYIVGGKTSKEGRRGEESISLVTFYNAYPVEAKEKLVTADVITPIYAKSFEEHKASPTPIFFIAIAPNVTFEFLLAIRRREIPSKVKSILGVETWEDLEDKVIMILKNSLTEWGIGAKTSSGYGVFGDNNAYRR